MSTTTTLVSATVSTCFIKPVNPGRWSFTVQILKASSYESILNCRETVLRLRLHGPHMGGNRRLRVIVRSDARSVTAVSGASAVTSISGGWQISHVLPSLLGLGAVLPGDKHVLCFRMHANFAAKDMAFAIVNKPRKTYEPVHLDQTWLRRFLSFLSAIIARRSTFTNHFNR